MLLSPNEEIKTYAVFLCRRYCNYSLYTELRYFDLMHVTALLVFVQERPRYT